MIASQPTFIPHQNDSIPKLGEMCFDLAVPLFQLFKTILKKLHPLFSIDCGVLLVYNQDLSTIVRAYVSAYNTETEMVETELIDSPVDLTSAQKTIAELTIPVLKTTADWMAEHGASYQLVNGISGYAHHCYIPLEVDNHIYGTLELHNLHTTLGTECLAFCSNIADLLAEVLYLDANGLLQQDMDRQLGAIISSISHPDEPFRAALESTMLKPGTFSNSSIDALIDLINNAASSDELQKLLNADIKAAVGAAEICLALIDNDEQMIYPYLSTSKSEEGLTEKLTIDDNLWNGINLNAKVSRPLAIEGRAKNALKYWLNWKGEPCYVVALSARKEIFGYLLISFADEEQLVEIDRLNHISSLLSPVVCNLLLTERLALQSQLIHQYQQENVAVAEPLPVHQFDEIIGQGQDMKQVFALMRQVAPSDSTVLILGETGTGKELIARGIHQASARKGETLIKMNCAAIPPNLIESELFGHERGAFTGATEKRLGKFEQADKGTLFLDEIGELPLDLQVKLLRALQEKEIERVGGKAVIKVDVRIVAATNRNLLAEVEAGRFRRDLYYRLNVFPISLPALRQRKDDIPLLAMHFLLMYAAKSKRQVQGFSQRALQQLANYEWPGNVRELEHLIERHVLLSQKKQIIEITLPVREKKLVSKDGTTQKVKTIDENERDHIFAVLQLCRGRISGPDGAAKLLGLPATTLNSKIKRLGLAKKHF